MSNRVFVIGVGMTKFEKPGTPRELGLPADGARRPGTKALEDAGVAYGAIEQAYVGYVYGESCSGQRAAYELGLTGIPIFNVNSNCSTGSTALYLAAQAIRSGQSDVTLALGFEKMQPGSLGTTFDDREQPMGNHMQLLAEISEVRFPPAPWMFGAAGREHMEQYGTTPEHFAKIGYKNHKHSVNNPYAQFQQEYTLEEILGSTEIYSPLTKLQCSPTSDGSGAAVLASEAFVDRHGLAGQAVEIVGQAMVTDFPSTFETRTAPRHHRLRHERDRRPRGVRAGRARPGGRPGHRAARLLLRQRAVALRGARPVRRGRGRASSSTTTTRRTAAAGWSTRPAG